MKITDEDCLPLNFFRKLPPNIKVEIDEATLHLFSESMVKAMTNNYYMIDWTYRMSPTEWDKIMKMSDDFEYFSMLNMWETLQPIYKNLFASTDYYQRYPEFLI